MEDKDEIRPATLETWWFGLPALGNALSTIPWFKLLFVPVGSVYDKSGPAVISLFIAAGTFLSGFCVTIALFRKRKIARGLFCAAFSLTPLIVGLGTAYVIGFLRGITISLFQQNP